MDQAKPRRSCSDGSRVRPFLRGGVEPLESWSPLSGIADVIHEDIDAVEADLGPRNNSNSILPVVTQSRKNNFRLAAKLTDFRHNGSLPDPQSCRL